MKASPAEVEEGEEVLLKCEASGSNPRPTLTWWGEGGELRGEGRSETPAPHGGVSVRYDCLTFHHIINLYNLSL